MKLKKVLAGVLASAMALTTVVTTSFTASAADAEYTVFPAAYGKLEDGLILNSEACTAINSATSTVEIAIDGTYIESAGWCQFYLQQNGPTWDMSTQIYSATDKLTIAVADSTLFGVDSYKMGGNNIEVNAITVAVDGGNPITAWSVPSEIVAPADGTLVSISADDLAAYGVTADNIADCYVKVTYSAAPTAGVYGAFVMNDWSSNFAYNDSVADTSAEISFANIGTNAANVLTDGVWLQFKSSTISGIKFVVPETKASYGITVAKAENGTVSVDKTTAAEGETVTITATAAEGYEVDTITVIGESGDVEVAEDGTFTMPAEEVTVTAAFKAVDASDEPGTDEPGTDKPDTDKPDTDEPVFDDSEKVEDVVIDAEPKPATLIAPINSIKKFEITDPVTGKTISTSVNRLAKALSGITDGSDLEFNTGDFGMILRKNVIQEVVDNDLTITIKTSKATFIIDAENLAKVKTINIPAIIKTTAFKKLIKEGDTFIVKITEKNKVEIELA